MVILKIPALAITDALARLAKRSGNNSQAGDDVSSEIRDETMAKLLKLIKPDSSIGQAPPSYLSSVVKYAESLEKKIYSAAASTDEYKIFVECAVNGIQEVTSEKTKLDVERYLLSNSEPMLSNFEDWHTGISNDARFYAVRKFAETISDSKVTFAKDLKTCNLLDYAEKLEKDLFKESKSKFDYVHRIAAKSVIIKKELRNKRAARCDEKSKIGTPATPNS